MLFTSSLLVDSLAILCVLIYLIYKYLSRKFNYWKDRKVEYIKPHLIFGNLKELCLGRLSISHQLANLYNQSTTPFFGMFAFQQPLLVIRSPEIIKQVLVKDFHNFDDRVIAQSHNEIVNSMLFLSKNPDWKNIRQKVTPIFTSGKLRLLVPLINEISKTMKVYIDELILKGPIEAKELCSQYITDVITKCAFGIEANSFQQRDSEFRKMARLFFDFRWSTTIQQTSHVFFPNLVKLFRMCFLDQKALAFIDEAFEETMKLRRKNKSKSNDFIDSIIKIVDEIELDKENNLDSNKILAQAHQFFVAAFETSTSTMAFTLYELCLHEKIQERLRNEIKANLETYGGYTYDAIANMKYLEMCVCETLRKYPVLAFLERRSRNDYKLPGSDVVIEKGTTVFIPMFGLHHDEQYYPDPEKFDPERFSEENKHKITPFTFIPFGKGPRNCLGERLGMLQVKLGLIHILADYQVERTYNTPVPIEFEPKIFTLGSKTGLNMEFKRCS